MTNPALINARAPLPLQRPLELVQLIAQDQIMDSVTLDLLYQKHRQRAVMLLARSRVDPNPADPLYGYRDLAQYIAQGFNEPFDNMDLYLRLLACAQAENSALPSITHMTRLMSMVWESNIVPPQHEQAFHHACHHVSESLCYDIGKFATDSMKSIAQTLRVELQVQMGYEKDTPEAEPQKPPEDVPAFTIEPGKPTLH